MTGSVAEPSWMPQGTSCLTWRRVTVSRIHRLLAVRFCMCSCSRTCASAQRPTPTVSKPVWRALMVHLSVLTSAWRAPLVSRLVYLGDDTGLVCELPTDMAFSVCLHTTPHPGSKLSAVLPLTLSQHLLIESQM